MWKNKHYYPNTLPMCTGPNQGLKLHYLTCLGVPKLMKFQEICFLIKMKKSETTGLLIKKHETEASTCFNNMPP